MEQLMTRQEVAGMLRVSLASLDRLVLRGEIPVIRIHSEKRGRVLFKLSEIQSWLTRRTFGAKERKEA